MSYSLDITMNLADDTEVDLPTTHWDTLTTVLKTIGEDTSGYPWTSLVVVIARFDWDKP